MNFDEYIGDKGFEEFDNSLNELSGRMREPLPSYEEYVQFSENERLIIANRIMTTCAVETSKYGGYYSLSAQIGTVDTESVKGAIEEAVVNFPVFEKTGRGRYADTLWALRRVKDPIFGYTNLPDDLGSIRFHYEGVLGNTEPPKLYVYENDDKRRDFDPIKDKEKVDVIDAVVRATLEKRRRFLEIGIGKKAVESVNVADAYRFSVADSVEDLAATNKAIEDIGPLDVNTQELLDAIKICDQLKANYQVLLEKRLKAK